MNTERIDIQANYAGPIVGRSAWKLYQTIVALMKRQNSRSVWLHDGQSSAAAVCKNSELKIIQEELKAAGFLNTKQSRWGCEYVLPSQKIAEAA